MWKGRRSEQDSGEFEAAIAPHEEAMADVKGQEMSGGDLVTIARIVLLGAREESFAFVDRGLSLPGSLVTDF